MKIPRIPIVSELVGIGRKVVSQTRKRKVKPQVTHVPESLQHRREYIKRINSRRQQRRYYG